MPLHLIKLCVGADSIRDLEEWISATLAMKRAAGRPAEQVHTTRSSPKRAEEVLDGGSLYWVIKSQIAARQRIVELRQVTDAEGIARCQLVLEPTVIQVMPRPQRPFQGWRYLADHEAPKDLSAGAGELAEMPEELRRELRDLGLL